MFDRLGGNWAVAIRQNLSFAIRPSTSRISGCARSFVYLAVFTRGIRGWELDRSLGGSLTLRALRRALGRGRSEIHHSDQGVQYAATAYTELLAEEEVAISIAAVGKPEENGYAERLMRIIKEEEVDMSEYEDLADARRRSRSQR